MIYIPPVAKRQILLSNATGYRIVITSYNKEAKLQNQPFLNSYEKPFLELSLWSLSYCSNRTGGMAKRYVLVVRKSKGIAVVRVVKPCWAAKMSFHILQKMSSALVQVFCSCKVMFQLLLKFSLGHRFMFLKNTQNLCFFLILFLQTTVSNQTKDRKLNQLACAKSRKKKFCTIAGKLSWNLFA